MFGRSDTTYVRSCTQGTGTLYNIDENPFKGETETAFYSFGMAGSDNAGHLPYMHKIFVEVSNLKNENNNKFTRYSYTYKTTGGVRGSHIYVEGTEIKYYVNNNSSPIETDWAIPGSQHTVKTYLQHGEHEIDGWYKDNTYSSKAGETEKVGMDTLNLYGRCKHTLTINPNGGKYNGTTNNTTATLIYGTNSASKLTQVATRTGYTFNGFWDSDTGGELVYGTDGKNKSGKYWTADYGNGNSGAGKYKKDDDLTVYAHWTPIKYNLTVNANGGTYKGSSIYYYNSDTTGQLQYDSKSLALISKATRDGYTLDGYYTAASGGTKVYDANGKCVQGDYWTANYGNGTESNGKYKYAGNLTVYAHWISNNPILKINPNGGTVTVNGGGSDVNITLETQYQMGKGATLQIKNPINSATNSYTSDINTTFNYMFNNYTEQKSVSATTRNSYVFDKWDGLDSLNGTLSWNSSTNSGTYKFPNVDNVTDTLKATYKIQSTTTPNENIYLPLTYSKTGHTFGGWYKEDTLENYIGTAGSSYTPTESRTLYAKWTPKTYNLTVNPNGGTYERKTTSTTYTDALKYGDTISNEITPSTRTGYTFKGYYNAAEGGTMVYDAEGKCVQGDYWSANYSTGTYKYDGNLTVYAQWEPNIYTITLDKQGGTGGTDKVYEKYATGIYQEYGCTTSITTITKPTKTGYTFEGYYIIEANPNIQMIDANGDIKFHNKTFTSNVTLYAKWTVIEYNITYNLTGGALPSGVTNPNKYTIETNTFTLNNPNKTGYTFSGWTGTGLSSASTSVTIAQGSTGDRTYTSNWTANIYTITLDKQSGTGGTDKVYEKYATGIYKEQGCTTLMTTSTNPITLPTRTGYTFGGYYTGTNGTGTQMIKADGYITGNLTTTTYTANATLYAKWTPITYTVKYNGNGATGGSTADSVHTYDVAKNLTENGFTRQYTVTYNYNGNGQSNTSTTAQYTFTKWNTNSAGTGTSYTNKQSVTNLASTNGATVNLYAQWNSNSVTLPTPTRTGYTFGGWYKEASCTNKVGDGGATYTPTANITLYAKWTPIEYNITYNLAGGALPSGVTNPNKYTIETNTFTLNNPNKTGYTFSGWTGTGLSSASTSVTIAQGSTGDRTYTSNWTANIYTITLDKQSGTGGTDKVYEKYATGIYKEQGCTTLMTTSTNPITSPTRTGYTFGGYYTGTNGTGTQMIKADGYITGNLTTTTYTANATLYAKWTAKTYNLTINPNGGNVQGSTSAITLTNVLRYDSTANNQISVSTRTGYIFDGYYTAASGGTKVYDAEGKCVQGNYWSANYSTGTYKYDGNLTVYAHWIAKTYNLTINPNGGKVLNSTSAITITNGLKYDATTNNQISVSTRTGYIFDGYYTAGGTKVYDAEGKCVQGDYWSANYSTGTYKYDGDLTVYAHWTPITYYIVYDGNGATGIKEGKNMERTVCTYDALPFNLKENGYYKWGYEFTGWKDGVGTFYEDKAQITTNLTATNGATITLYAQWNLVKTSVEGSIEWIDNNNEFELRPANVTVNLQRSPTSGKVSGQLDTYTSTASNSFKFTGLQKYRTDAGTDTYKYTGNPYTFTVSQNPINWYETTVKPIDANNVIIYNTMNKYSVSGTVFIDSINNANDLLNSSEELPKVLVTLYDTDDPNKHVEIKCTDSNGNYEFTNLKPNKKYYVKFTYNGLIYTNVAKKTEEKGSKAEEKANERDALNEKFKKIGAYPENYFADDCITGEYKSFKTWDQKEIVVLFNEVAQEIVNQNGNEKDAYQAIINRYSSDSNIESKVQFIADCRISAYTGEQVPTINGVSTRTEVGGIGYREYKQTNLNCGIKVRNAVDLALKKDIVKAEVEINGKHQTYNYSQTRRYGEYAMKDILESNYKTDIRQLYIRNNNYIFSFPYNLEQDMVSLYIREEDVNINYENFNHDNDDLKVYVTYKIGIKNQATGEARITEIVDYYAPEYTVKDAYLEKNGNRYAVEVSDHSKNSRISTQKTSPKTSPKTLPSNETLPVYKTSYLVPEDKNLYLAKDEEYFIYVKLQMNLGDLKDKRKTEINAMNIAEINGYETKEGLIDIDSNVGMLDMTKITEYSYNQVKTNTNIEKIYCDAVNNAPMISYKLAQETSTPNISRTIEGYVFEDGTTLNGRERKGNGGYDTGETKIAGVKVQLVEIKNGEERPRMETYTDDEGHYKFAKFIPGDYIIKFTYGNEKYTALPKDITWDDSNKGNNAKSYNGQDYQSTEYNANLYTNQYWYSTNINTRLSDAKDTPDSISRVTNYSKDIINHKALVFNSYKTGPIEFANELMENTYREATTATMNMEVEFATTTTNNQGDEYKITNVDFGIAKRPKTTLQIDQDVKQVKLILSDGTEYVNATNDGNRTIINNLNAATTEDIAHMQWLTAGKIEDYDKNEQVNITLDEEIMSGAQIEITYNITVFNDGEEDKRTSGGNIAKTAAKGIVNYVANNITYNESDNKIGEYSLWKVVSKGELQPKNGEDPDLINELIELDGQAVIIMATENNPLTKPLLPGESATTTLTLKKILSAESGTDNTNFTNLTEIVEIESEVGRYDQEAIPGNQNLFSNPKEHDASGAKIKNKLGYVDLDEKEPDGTVIIAPPTGENKNHNIYYVIGFTSTLIIAIGIFTIKKFKLSK